MIWDFACISAAKSPSGHLKVISYYKNGGSDYSIEFTVNLPSANSKLSATARYFHWRQQLWYEFVVDLETLDWIEPGTVKCGRPTDYREVTIDFMGRLTVYLDS